ncbi:MAG: hypothetical protein CMI90_02145 [Pelagibacteraceae bacterium]|nr:hypothetical protein [Pelagibacteraceae bacterium]|tara:strand:- start:1393 stop:1851 length:459 start_codon:yes stop_codon:yes gene_type:complete
MPQIEQTEFFLSQLFWLMVLFVVLFLVLTYYTIPKIRAFLNKRDNFVKDHLSKQDALIKKAELLIQEYDEKINKAKEEANQIIEQARNTAQKESEVILKTTENKIQQQIKETEDKIMKEKTIAFNNLEKELRESATLFVSKITDQPSESIKL